MGAPHQGQAPAGARRPTRPRARRADPDAWTPLDRWIEVQGRYKKLTWSLGFAGLVGFLFAIITYRLPIGEASIALGALGLMVDRRGVVFPNFLLLLGGFLAWCALGIATSRYPSLAQESTIVLAKLWIVWLVALGAVRSRAQFRWLLIFMTVFYATHPMRGAIFNRVFYGGGGGARASWNRTIFGNPNDLAAMTLLFLGIAAALLVSERKGLIRLGALASCIVYPVVILLTQSRANFIGLGVFAVLALLGGRKKLRGVMFLGLVGAAAAITVPQEAWDRLSGVTELTGGTEQAIGLDSSARERVWLWRVARRTIRDHPVNGTGWGTYNYANSATVSRYPSEFSFFEGRNTLRDAHSTPFTVLAETGIPGFLLWISAILSVVVYAERRRKKYEKISPRGAKQILMLELGLLAYAVASIWGSYQAISFLYIHLTLIWVSANMLERDHKRLLAAGAGPRGAPPGKAAWASAGSPPMPVAPVSPPSASAHAPSHAAHR